MGYYDVSQPGEYYALRQQEKGDRFREEADAWVADNPEAWDYMVRQAVNSARAGRRFGIGSLVEHVRWHMFAEGRTGFKCNNNHRAALARRIIAEHPETRPYIQTRDSVCDL